MLNSIVEQTGYPEDIIEIDADLSLARVLLSLTVVVPHDDEGHIGDADKIAREAMGTAIRSNGGRHEELLSVADESRLDTHEMARTFNCGIGMVMLVPASEADSVLERSRKLGLDCCDMGEVEPGSGRPRVRFV